MTGMGAGERWERLESEFHLELSPDSKDKVRLYLALLEKWRKHLNLTSLDHEDDILRYHFFESFWAADQFLTAGCRLVDIGSGAGFPGLAVALYLPLLNFALIESNQKKAVFLEEVARRLGVSARVYCCRAEEFEGWDRFSIASLRAVRLSSRLLRTLSEARLELLWFHGSKEPVPGGWQVITSKKVPGARTRVVSRLASLA